MALKRILYIYYPIQFKKMEVQALINLGSKFNTMTLVYASKLGFRAQHTNVEVWNIDGSTLETFGMVLTSFQVEDKLGKARFFQETFLFANISVKVILSMPFFTPSNANI